MSRALFIISLAMAAMIWPGDKAWAEEEPAVEMAPVVVTADRWGETEENTTDRVTRVDREAIEKLPARDAGEALDFMPGVIMGRAGAGGVGSPVFPSVQGADYYQTPVMINGIPFSDLLNGMGNLGQIPAEVISGIEVVHGAGGMEWGSTQGGLINVALNAPDRSRHNSVTAGGGQHGTVVGGLDLQHWTESFGVAVGGGYRAGEGPEKGRTEVKNNTGTLGVKALFGEKAKLDASVYSLNGEYGTGEYRADAEGYYSIYKYNTLGAGVTLESQTGFGAIRVNAFHQTQDQKSDEFMLEEFLGQSTADETVNGGSAIAKADLGFAAMVAGVDAKAGELNSSQLMGDKYKISQYGVFAHLSRQLEGLSIEAGGRYSNEDNFGTFTAFNAGVKYTLPSAPVDIRVSAASGFTTPPLSFRYLEMTDLVAANPDLTVETVMTYQAGVVIRPAHGLTLDINGFFASLKDAIASDLRDDGLYWYRNYKKAERSGVEAEIRYETHDGLNLFANTLSQTVKDTDAGEVLKGKVKAAHSFGAGYQLNRLYMQVSGSWRDGNEPEENLAKDKVWVMGLKAFYKLPVGGKEVVISLNVNNLTDAEYWSMDLMPKNHPRDIEAAIQYVF